MLELKTTLMYTSNNLDELESHIDRVISGLKIYKLPLDRALYNTLAEFEVNFDSGFQSLEDRLSREVAMLYAKAGLQMLVPRLYNTCEQSRSLCQDSQFIEDEVLYSAQAIHFCERYAIAAHCFTQYHKGWFVGTFNDRIATFAYPEGTDFGRAQLNFTLHQYHENRTYKQSFAMGKLPPSIGAGKCVAALHQAIQFNSGKLLLHLMPDEVYIPFREIVEATLPEPSIDGSTKCASYSVDDYHSLWLEFATIAFIHCSACHEEYRKNRKFASCHRLLQFDIDELADLLASRGNISHSLAMGLLPDLVLDLKATRPDVLVQPLLPLSNTNILILAPSLIYTTNWEVCLLRNWATRYPNTYGRVVAQKKERLAQDFGNVFNKSRFRISTCKKVKDIQGKDVGDVDVAVFAPDEGLLAVFELKWLIEPDSIREAIRADEEISKGIDQVLRSKREFETNPSNFLRQIFPGMTITSAEVKEVIPFVIGHGDIGGEPANRKSREHNVHLLDYLLSCDVIREYCDMPLREILTHAINRHLNLSKDIEDKSTTLQMKLAGFLFCLPGYGRSRVQSSIPTAYRQKTSRNDQCLCGSGIKYKKCCRHVEAYHENT